MKQFRDAELWIAAQTYTNLYYVGARLTVLLVCKKSLKRVSPLLNVCSLDGRIFQMRFSEQEDFEDILFGVLLLRR